MKTIKKLSACAIAVVLLVSMLSLSMCVSADSTKRPDNFDPWYSFDNLNVGSDSTITGEDDTNTCNIGGIPVIECRDRTMDIKAGFLQDCIVNGSNGQKLITFGAGKNYKTDSTKYKDSCWNNVNISTKGDDKFSTKAFKNEEYFCFYADMTKWSTEARAATEATAANLKLWIFLGASYTVEDADYEGLHILELGKNYELQQEDGTWKSFVAEGTAEDVNLTLADGSTDTVQQKNGYIALPRGFKGYVRFKLADTYPATYFNETPKDQALAGKDSVTPCTIQMHGGFSPKAVGVGDDMTEPGHLEIGDFGFIRKDGAPAPDTTKTDDSKVAAATDDTSKAADKADTAAKTETQKGNNTVIIVVIVVAVVVIGAGIVFFVTKKSKAKPETKK